jgi:short-subunit dehydrogenase involved in D-alanine esterification of teichoic acids
MDVLKFVEYVKTNYKRVHILINNAAQTVRRPILYYQSLIEKEKQKLPAAFRTKVQLPDPADQGDKKGVFDIANGGLSIVKNGKTPQHKTDAISDFDVAPTANLQFKALEVLTSNLIPEDFIDKYEPKIRMKTWWNTGQISQSLFFTSLPVL